MFQRVEIASPALKEIGDRFQTVAEFYSVFFRPVAAQRGYPDFDRGHTAILMEVLESDFLRTCMPQLFPLNLDSARNFCLLNRFEFEGSLIHFLLQGTCTEKVIATEAEARNAARSLLAETMLRPDGSLWAFRMDDGNWSKRIQRATLSATYFVYAPFDKTWWFFGFADDY